MSLEVICGQCQGRLLVEQTGVVVACPHCGAHLSIAAPEAPVAAAPEPVIETPAPSLAEQFAEATRIDVPTPTTVSVPASEPETAMAPGSASAAPAAEFDWLKTDDGPAPDPAQNTVLAPPEPSSPAPSEAFDWLKTDEGPAPDPFQNTVVAPLEPAPLESFAPPIEQKPAPALITPVAEPLIEPPAAQFSFEAAEDVPTDTATSPAVEQTLLVTPPIAVTEESASHDEAAFPEFAGEGQVSLPPAVEEFSAPSPSPVPQLEQTSALPDAPAAGWSEAPTEALHPVAMAGVPADLAATVATTAAPSSTPAASAASTAAAQLQVAQLQGQLSKLKLLCLLLASLASAFAVALVLSLMRGQSTLDLPDLVPKIHSKTGEVGLTIIPEDRRLPASHRLQLGESRRFGNLLVTPVKVTRGKLNFQHFSNPKLQKSPTNGDVLKLWVKFENVSADQTFTPLDKVILFTRVNDKSVETQTRSNNYICQTSQRTRKGKRIPVYELSTSSEWDLKEQHLDQDLPPQGTLETYLPTNEEDLSSLEGSLVWRMQFRKGYHPESGRGVTTVVEVEFDSDEIQKDSAAS